jgi:hypothetical protein
MLVEKLGDEAPSLFSLNLWSMSFNWVKRAESFDREVEERKRELAIERESEYRVMVRDERLNAARAARGAAMKLIVDPKLRTVKERPTPREVEAAANAIARVGDQERLDLGEATERTEETRVVIVRSYGENSQEIIDSI